MLRQIVAVTKLNLMNLPNRWSTSIVIVVGIGGVVLVLVAIFSMALGINSVFENSIDDQRVVIVRTGAEGELSSSLDIETANIVKSISGLELVAPELFMVADIPKKATGTPANLVVRGVSENSFAIRPEVTVLTGRFFESGKNEIIVGTKAQQEFEGLEIGEVIVISQFAWEVVGVFEADGSTVESEIWASLGGVQSAFRYDGAISAIRAQLADVNQFNTVKEAIENDPRLPTDILTEQDWYSKESERGTFVIRIFGTVIAIIMSIGAIFAALNTMYVAVASRTFEIATLRALGFGGLSVLISVIIEALILALIGGLLGAGVAYFAFNGFTVSTLSSTSFSQLAFDFAVTPQLVLIGLVLSLVLGFIGGLFPALRAVLMPITAALRGE